MTRLFEIAEHWSGLCRKTPAVHALQTGFPAESAFEGQPGGGGGAGSVRRGIGSALSGMRTLNRNPQLLWFALLAGLVFAGSAICFGALRYIDWTLSDGILPLVLNFVIEFATLLFLVFVLASLILSIPSKDGSASFVEGLAGAKKYLKTICVWAFILALAGMLLDRVFFYPGGFFWPVYSHVLSLLTQFPFTLNLNPSTFAEIPGYGGRSPLFWTYPYGFMDALTFSAINLFLVLLTAFVVPLIVLEKKGIRGAVAGSFAVMRKAGSEVTACAVFLGVIVSGVFLTYLLVQAAHGMFTPPDLIYAIPTGPWIALGLLYYLALFSMAFVMATAGAIAVLDLYRHATIREGA
jgi:hypothetical protein